MSARARLRETWQRLTTQTPACALGNCGACDGWARSTPWSELFPCRCPHHHSAVRLDGITREESALANAIASAILASRHPEPVLLSTRYRAAYAAIATLRERDARAQWVRDRTGNPEVAS